MPYILCEYFTDLKRRNWRIFQFPWSLTVSAEINSDLSSGEKIFRFIWEFITASSHSLSPTAVFVEDDNQIKSQRSEYTCRQFIELTAYFCQSQSLSPSLSLSPSDGVFSNTPQNVAYKRLKRETRRYLQIFPVLEFERQKAKKGEGKRHYLLMKSFRFSRKFLVSLPFRLLFVE